MSLKSEVGAGMAFDGIVEQRSCLAATFHTKSNETVVELLSFSESRIEEGIELTNMLSPSTKTSTKGDTSCGVINNDLKRTTTSTYKLRT